MNRKQLSKMVAHHSHRVPAAQAEATDAASARSERGRRTLLVGWVVSMIGIVLYFFVMSSGDQEADPLPALIAHGPMGWGALLIILAGIALWFSGCVAMLNNAEHAGTDV